jgi:hypothetical protein
LKKEREADGNKKYRAVKALYDAKNWAEAQKGLADLEENYADALADKMKDIKTMRERCDKEVAADKAALVDDGESGAAGWEAGGAAGRVEAEESTDAKVGGKSIKMTFKKHSEAISAGTWPRLEHAVAASPSDETVAVSFWAKSAQPFKISVELRLYSGDDEVVYSAQRTLGTSWQLFQVPLTEFKELWKHPRRKTSAKLNAYNIQKVGFATASPGADAVALLDHIKFDLRGK